MAISCNDLSPENTGLVNFYVVQPFHFFYMPKNFFFQNCN